MERLLVEGHQSAAVVTDDIFSVPESPKMKQVLLVLAAFWLGAQQTNGLPTTDQTDIISQILRATQDLPTFSKVTQYLEKSRDDLIKELPALDSDGKQLSYTFFAPTSHALRLSIPQDVADPFLLDSQFRLKVLLRHFSRQDVKSLDDLAKSELIMADSATAKLTRCPHRVTSVDSPCINDVTIHVDKVIQLNNGFVYQVDGVFTNGEEVGQVLSKHPNKSGFPFFGQNPHHLKGRSTSPDDEEVISTGSGLDIRNTPLGQPILGGFFPAATNETDVIEMAEFATVYWSNKVNSSPALKLFNIVKAEKQVVSGLNYRLELELIGASGTKFNCVALVYDQAWTSTRQVSSMDC